MTRHLQQPPNSIIVRLLDPLISFLSTVTEWTGKAISWLSLLMVFAVVGVLLLRNVFEVSAIPLQESISYMHALVFMFGAAFTLRHNDHVRVDVFYQHFSPRKKSLVDCLGFALLLAPVCIFIIVYCWGYVQFNWELKEGSSQPGGLPYLYVLKGLLVAMPITLLLEGLAQFLHNVLFLLGQTTQSYAERFALNNDSLSDSSNDDERHMENAHV